MLRKGIQPLYYFFSTQKHFFYALKKYSPHTRPLLAHIGCSYLLNLFLSLDFKLIIIGTLHVLYIIKVSLYTLHGTKFSILIFPGTTVNKLGLICSEDIIFI